MENFWIAQVIVFAILTGILIIGTAFAFIQAYLVCKESIPKWITNNFNTSVLWQNQQNCINCILAGAPSCHANTINILRQNLFCKLAEYFAPSNLVIRNLCILDLLDKTNNEKRILNQVRKLTSAESVWLEGYSYWSQDVRPILKYWDSSNITNTITWYITVIERAFIKTAYLKNGQFWPAPIGDLTEIPLDNITMGYLGSTSYVPVINQGQQNGIVKANPVGLNMHTNDVSFYYEYLSSGLWQSFYAAAERYRSHSFIFYTGEGVKYPTKWIYAKAILFRIWILLQRKVGVMNNPGKCTYNKKCVNKDGEKCDSKLPEYCDYYNNGPIALNPDEGLRAHHIAGEKIIDPARSLIGEKARKRDCGCDD